MKKRRKDREENVGKGVRIKEREDEVEKKEKHREKKWRREEGIRMR